MARSKKRRGQGRKRKALPRTTSGRLSRSVERRTIERAQSDAESRTSLTELLASRGRGLGLSPDQSADPISSTIAGRMALRGLLTRVQAEAVDEYAQLVRRAAIAMQAPAGPRCSLSLSRGGDGIDDAEGYAYVMRCYNDAFGAVRNAGHRACRAVNIVVRDLCELPGSEREAMRLGASALVGHFGLAEARAA